MNFDFESFWIYLNYEDGQVLKMGVNPSSSFSFFEIEGDGLEVPLILGIDVDTNTSDYGWVAEWTIPYSLVGTPVSMQV